MPFPSKIPVKINNIRPSKNISKKYFDYRQGIVSLISLCFFNEKNPIKIQLKAIDANFNGPFFDATINDGFFSKDYPSFLT